MNQTHNPHTPGSALNTASEAGIGQFEYSTKVISRALTKILDDKDTGEA